MSNPAAVPEWLEEDFNATTTVAAPTATRTPDVEDPGGTGWLEDDSPATTVPRTQQPTENWLADDPPSKKTSMPQPLDNVIHAPSGAGTTDSDLETSKKKKKKNKTKTKKKEKATDKNDRDNNKRNTDTRNPRVGASIDANTNVNNGGNNNAPTNAQAASERTWGQFFKESFQRDGRLILITIGVLILMNIPYIWWVLYPFALFSTWIHEVCHGMAAVVSGGAIDKLQIYPDTSGLAFTSVSNIKFAPFVTSAGYQGTAFVGFLLLLFRRTKRGPRTGTMVIACSMLLSCILWIRNVFGFIFIFCFGLILVGLAVKLPSSYIRTLYVFLAVMCSLNSITSVRALFGSNHNVNGEPVESDAHTMADYTNTSYLLWATLWLLLAIILMILGILFAIPGPDEVADFKCCGVCQDLGCFKLCNYPGQRWMSRLRGNDNGQETSANATQNSNAGEP